MTDLAGSQLPISVAYGEGIADFSQRGNAQQVLMPHPERMFRNVQMSFAAGGDVSARSLWMRMFQNTRRVLG